MRHCQYRDIYAHSNSYTHLLALPVCRSAPLQAPAYMDFFWGLVHPENGPSLIYSCFCFLEFCVIFVAFFVIIVSVNIAEESRKFLCLWLLALFFLIFCFSITWLREIRFRKNFTYNHWSFIRFEKMYPNLKMCQFMAFIILLFCSISTIR
jgi:hypothetical protein